MRYFILILTFIFNFSSVQDSFSLEWKQRLNGRSVWSIAEGPDGQVFAGGLTGANSRIWVSYDDGYSWDTIYIGSGQTMWDFAFDNAGNMYVANFSNGLLKSTNGGLNFTIIQSTPYFNGKNLQGVACGSDGHVFVTTSTGFFRSTDFGTTFTESALTGLNCLPVLVDRDSSNIVYVGVSSAGGSGIGVYRSTNNGLTFSDNLLPNANGYSLMQTGSGDLYRLTTTSPYTLAKSTNKGLSWISLANLPGAMRGITQYAPSFSDTVLYVAGNGGVFKSTDGGLSFINDNFTFNATPILNVMQPVEHYTLTGVSGTANGGVWIYYNALIQNISETGVSISGYRLNQNYPNPFNPATTISFTIPVRGHVKLSVSDVTGKVVAVLVNERQNAGSYIYQFSIDDYHLSSGVYFYTLRVNGTYSETKKMVVLR